MDRFVTRAPTWKTMNYESIAASSNLKPRASMQNKSSNASSILEASNKRKTLNVSKLPSNFFQSKKDTSPRLDSYFKPLSQQATTHNCENHNANSNDSGLSSGSAQSISPPLNDFGADAIKVVGTPKKMLAKPVPNLQFISKQTPNKKPAQSNNFSDALRMAATPKNMPNFQSLSKQTPSKSQPGKYRNFKDIFFFSVNFFFF